MKYSHILFDWGNTLMEDLPGQQGPMATWPEVAVVSGAREALALLSQQAPCHIATNAEASDEIAIRQALQRGGLDTYVSEIFCYRRIGLSKPDARFFHTVAASLATPANRMVMVGDSLANDVMGARAAGMDAIWLNRHGGKAPAGITMITRLEELPALLLP